MRKSIKKIVSVVTAAALAFAGAMVSTPVVAKAEPVTKTIHIINGQDLTEYTGAAFQVWGMSIDSKELVNFGTVSSGWGEGNETPVKLLTLTDNKQDVQVTYNGEESGMQFIMYTDTKADSINSGHNQDDLKKMLTATETEFWVTFANGTYSYSLTDPAQKTKVELAIDAIDAIGEVTLASEGKIKAAEEAYAAVEETEKSQVTNYATLTKARADYDALKAAQDKANAEAAGKLTVYVKTPTEWKEVGIYGWTDAGDLFGGWPGTTMTACDNNAGYYKATVAVDGLANLIFLGGDGDIKNTQIGQTENIEGLAAGEYWFTLTEYPKGHDPADINGRTGYTVESSKEAPAGWVAEEAAEIETQPTTEATEKDTEESTEAEDSSWEDTKLKVHFLNSEEWEKVGIYLTYGSWAEISGAWPGAEMQLEVGSETWYAYGTNGTAEETYNVIFNNMVSDAETEEGGVKHQTPDTKDLTVGEYWFVLGEVTGETETQITYAVQMFESVEALEEAGYTYDGEGLDSFEEPETDPKDDKEPETDPEDDKADSKGPTGDAAPIAVVLLGLAAVGAVIASKKSQNA